MINVNTSWSIFIMQNHLKQITITWEKMLQPIKVHSEKIGLFQKFWKSKFDALSKTVLILLQNVNPLELRYIRGQWGYSGISKTGWIRLHAATGTIPEWLGHWISNPRSTVYNHWVVQRSMQPFILSGWIKWITKTPGELVVKTASL